MVTTDRTESENPFDRVLPERVQQLAADIAAYVAVHGPTRRAVVTRAVVGTGQEEPLHYADGLGLVTVLVDAAGTQIVHPGACGVRRYTAVQLAPAFLAVLASADGPLKRSQVVAELGTSMWQAWAAMERLRQVGLVDTAGSHKGAPWEPTEQGRAVAVALGLRPAL